MHTTSRPLQASNDGENPTGRNQRQTTSATLNMPPAIPRPLLATYGYTISYLVSKRLLVGHHNLPIYVI